MQSTQSLILEYGRSRIYSKAAHRCRKRIRRRAKKGDVIATKFLGAIFKRSANIDRIRINLLAWFKQIGEPHG